MVEIIPFGSYFAKVWQHKFGSDFVLILWNNVVLVFKMYDIRCGSVEQKKMITLYFFKPSDLTIVLPFNICWSITGQERWTRISFENQEQGSWFQKESDLRWFFCFELCVINAGPDTRERVCIQIEPTLSPSAVLLPVLCQSYCPISVQHAFLGMDMSDPCLSPSVFYFILVYHPILDYNASGFRVPVAQWLEHCVSSAKVVGSIPREHTYWQKNV